MTLNKQLKINVHTWNVNKREIREIERINRIQLKTNLKFFWLKLAAKVWRSADAGYDDADEKICVKFLLIFEAFSNRQPWQQQHIHLMDGTF